MVQRLNLDIDHMIAHPTGEYVTYTSYQALEHEYHVYRYGTKCVELAKQFNIEPSEVYKFAQGQWDVVRNYSMEAQYSRVYSIGEHIIDLSDN